MEPTQQEVYEFQETVWRYYDNHGRVMPWREVANNGSIDPYKVMVSEIMLQQTQVGRVMSKYITFLQRFPTVQSLAESELGEVLIVWSGLGYNRRAKFLWQAGKVVAEEYGGLMPKTSAELQRLPGIGPNTAAAIAVYAYDSPEVFVETNIRTVFIYHFFAHRTDVHDKEILACVSRTLPQEHFREWYWALMDYGAYLKATVGNPNTASRHYAKQSKFEGSQRQLRGAVLRQLMSGPMTLNDLRQGLVDDRLEAVLSSLLKEEIIRVSGETYSL